MSQILPDLASRLPADGKYVVVDPVLQRCFILFSGGGWCFGTEVVIKSLP